MESQEIMTGKVAGKEKEHWLEYILSERQKTPERIENTAKAISGIISVTLTLLIFLINGTKNELQFNTYKLVVILWLISIILAFFVLFPFPYRYSSISINTFIQLHKKSVSAKYIILIISVILYLMGMIFLSIERIIK